jgi:hypothetical protein
MHGAGMRRQVDQMARKRFEPFKVILTVRLIEGRNHRKDHLILSRGQVVRRRMLLSEEHGRILTA